MVLLRLAFLGNEYSSEFFQTLLAVLLRLAFLGNEYSSEFFQTLLAVPHFSNVARKSQKQSSRGVL